MVVDPTLAQIEPKDLFDRLGDLVYLVLIIGGILLSAIQQSRQKKKKEQERSGGKPPPVAQGELEKRVRRFLEAQQPAPTRHAPVPPPPARPAEKPVPAAAAPAAGSYQHAIAARRQSTRDARTAPLSEVAPALQKTRGRRTGRQGVGARALLKGRDALRRGIVAREVLGPPRGLGAYETPGRRA